MAFVLDVASTFLTGNPELGMLAAGLADEVLGLSESYGKSRAEKSTSADDIYAQWENAYNNVNMSTTCALGS